MNTRMANMSSSSSIPTTPAPCNSSKEEMSPSGTMSPVQSMAGMGSPHGTGLGMKPGTQKPPAAVLQVVKQVQAEAARQQVSHAGNYGKLGPNSSPMHPPNMRAMGNHMNPNVSKPQHSVGTAGGNVGMGVGNASSNMGMDQQWGAPRYPNNANNPQLRSPNPNQIMQPNQGMQGNQV